MFWSDLASAHYAKSVASYLISKNITFVQKADNPPAVPELRPVENFCSILKRMVYKNNWQATSVDELKQRIKYCLKKVDVNAVQNMCGGVYRKLNFVRRNGETRLLANIGGTILRQYCLNNIGQYCENGDIPILFATRDIYENHAFISIHSKVFESLRYDELDNAF